MDRDISRRSFLALSAALPGLFLPRRARSAPPVVFRRLGRTGLKVSEVGMGVMITSDPNVVRAALDRGINYFDTARAYMGGRNEEVLAAGLKGRRREAVVATKCHRLGRKATVVATVEQSLASLGTDVIDILQLHGLNSRSQVLLDDHLEALRALKAAGKIRFAGVTTHSNMVEVIDAAVEARLYDVVLTSFNFAGPPEVAGAVGRAAAAGLGVVAMKIMAGAYSMDELPGLNRYQSALRWVLRHPAVSTTIPSITTLKQLEENADVMGSTASLRDELSLSLYAAVVDGRYCRACGACRGQCPAGADLPTALRALMYHEGYGRDDLARETLAGLDLPCADCADCSVDCRFGLPLARRAPSAAALARRLRA